MKCPHCNQEHPDGFQFCPTTGQKISILKACPNINCPDCGKCILPLDSLFCPRCGQRLANDSIIYVNPLDLKWPIINNFFPLRNIFIGKTQIGEIDKEKYRVEKLDNCFITKIKDVYFFTDHNLCSATFIRAYIKTENLSSNIWKDVSFNKNASFNDFTAYFDKLGFNVRIQRKPTLNRYEGSISFHAGFKAIAPDKSITMVLEFYGDGSSTPDTPNTLESIRISIHTDINIEGELLGKTIRIWKIGEL